MKRDLQQYIQIPVRELTPKQTRDLTEVVLYMLESKNTIDIATIEEKYKNVQSIMIPHYNKILKKLIRQGREIEKLEEQNRILSIILVFLHNDFKNYQELQEATGCDYKTLDKFLHRKMQLRKVLTEETANGVIEKVELLDLKESLELKNTISEICSHKDFQQYIQIPVRELTPKQTRDLNEVVLYMLESKNTIDITTIEEKYKNVQSIMIPHYNKILKKLIRQGREIEKLEEQNRILSIILVFLHNDFKNYQELQEATGCDYKTLNKILHKKIQLRKVLTEETTNRVIEKVELLDLKEKERLELKNTISEIRSYDEYFEILLNSRYNCIEMREQTGIERSVLDLRFQNGFIEKYYPPEFIEDIKNKMATTNIVKAHLKSNISILKDPRFIKLVKPEVIKVTSYDLKLLNMVQLLFDFHGDIAKIITQNPKIPNYSYALSCVMDKRLEEILNEESYHLLQRTLQAEQNFCALKIPEKQNLIETTVQYYYIMNGNIMSLLDRMEISKEEVFRILSDNLVEKTYGQDISQMIQASIKEYEEKEFVIKKLQQSKEKVKSYNQ